MFRWASSSIASVRRLRLARVTVVDETVIIFSRSKPCSCCWRRVSVLRQVRQQRAGGRRAQPVGGARCGLHEQRQLLRAQESRDLTARGGLYDPCMPPGTRSR